MSDLVRVRVVVEGRVQGVWFRESTRREAQRLGVAGWVRNLSDGSVEAVFEGGEPAVETIVAWAHRGPERAAVTGIERSDETPEGATGFEIRR